MLIFAEGATAVTESFKSSFILSGLIVSDAHKPDGILYLANWCQAGCCFVGLMVHSPSAIRHAFYETFLHLHIAMVVVGFALLWIHLKGLVAQAYLLAAIILWALEVCNPSTQVSYLANRISSEEHASRYSYTVTSEESPPPQRSRRYQVTPCESH